MDQDQMDRIEEQISAFHAFIGECLSMRVKSWSSYDTVRSRTEGFADDMVEMSNLATSLESNLSMMMVLKTHIDSYWDEAVTSRATARIMSDRYRSFNEIRHEAMAMMPEVYQLKCKMDAVIESAKRAVERIASMQSVASRAAGIAQGHG